MNQDKLFAEFLGYKYYPHPDEMKCAGWRKDTGDKFIHPKISMRGAIGERVYLARTTNDLRFSDDWNWLMAVVERIESWGHTVDISNSYCGIKDFDIYEVGDIKIGAVLRVCVKFVEMWNMKFDI